ncbi:Heat shock protein GrpE [Labilithrix luteola]|uniref:Protein GrpE n=1 Tax=Labilithrix luteola TaxID=1391654 RepID=A0A0K1PSG2_9BACT|nr:nucleotide exchange factor GrpE [Labilithrix luteola]AKU96480.1 Heat shock protein GrpE [Labilithrix luteola]
MTATTDKNGEESPNSENGQETEAEEAAPSDPLAEAKAEAARMKDQWVRTAADFDNYRKRSRKEVEDARKGGREELLKEVLPVFDNLERAIQSAQRATEVKPVAEGLGMILRQLLETLSRSGITKVPAVGHQFDPTVHEAIQQVETDDQPPGAVVAEVQPGYVQGDRLIRAAMVVVAKPKPKTNGEGGEGSGA